MKLYSPVISGSLTVSGSTTFIGNITMSGSLSATASNSLLLDGTGSVGFTTTGSFTTMSGSVSTRVSQIESVYATTGSNSFRATQSITGSLTVTGQIIAQTLNVQQVTSSIIYSSGSNTFGCDLNSRQTFTGSFYQTGSVAYFSGCVGVGSNSNNGYRLEVTNASCATGYVNVFYGLHTGNNTFTIRQFGANHPTAASVNQIGVLNAEQHLHLVTDTQACIDAGTSTKGIFLRCGGNVGIGMQSPSSLLHIQKSSNSGDGGVFPMIIVNNCLATQGDGSTSYNFSAIYTNSGNGAVQMAMLSSYAAGTWEPQGILNVATNHPMVLKTNNTERMRITCAGNVGIGTCTPAYSLSVKSGWIHNYGAQNASGFRYENDAAGHVLNLNANNSYAQLYTSTDTSLYFGTSNDIRLKILNTGETCFKCNAYFCSSTYGIMGFGEKVMDKICYIMTTSGTICVPLDGLTYGSGPTRAIYLYGTLLGNDSLQYAHMVYFYRNDYGGLQAATIAQASCAHPSTAGQTYAYTVNDPGGLGKSACTLLLRLTSSGAGVAPGSYCTQMRIVVYNVPGA